MDFNDTLSLANGTLYCNGKLIGRCANITVSISVESGQETHTSKISFSHNVNPNALKGSRENDLRRALKYYSDKLINDELASIESAASRYHTK